MDKKVIIGILVFIAVIIGGAILYSNSTSKAAIEKTAGAKVATFESSFDFKNIPYSGGNVSHEFKIKNNGSKDLIIANLATSCMCTKVYFEARNIKGPEFAMKGMSGESSWKGTLKSNETGVIVAIFDPTAHGPSGIGSISRIVSFETNDPDHPYVEFAFSGVVIK